MQGLQWLRKDFVNSISHQMIMILPKKINVENEVLEINDFGFRFYDVMKYPIPLEKDFFAYHSLKKV